MKYKIIFSNKDFIVVDKPAGVLTHSARHIKENGLIEELVKKYPEIARVGEDPERPGIMHRLDKMASGLLVIAKNQETFDILKDQFKKRSIVKKYKALVYGRIEKDEAEINFPLKRSVKGNKMAAIPATKKGEENAEGKRAISEFFTEKKFINHTLLDVRIKTGRTHQIRAHLSAYGHPLVGDDLYGTKKTKIKNQKISLGRIFLHAYYLEFKDKDGQKQSFRCDLPPELSEFLKNCKPR